MKSRRCEASGLFCFWIIFCSPSFIPYISDTPSCPGYFLITHRPSSSERFFLCEDTACVRSSSTAPLTVPGYYGSLPQIEDWLSVPASLQGKAGQAGFCSYIRRLGIPFHPVHCLLALSVLFPLSVLHKNHSPTRS